MGFLGYEVKNTSKYLPFLTARIAMDFGCLNIWKVWENHKSTSKKNLETRLLNY